MNHFSSRLLVKMTICHHAILPSETSKETEIKTTAQAHAERNQSCWCSCVCCLCISDGFLSASLFGVLGLTLVISIDVSLWYFLPTASRAEWSCGRSWNATASSGTWKTFIPNFGTDVRSPPASSRPVGCSIPPCCSTELSSAPETQALPPMGFTEGRSEFCAGFEHSLLTVWCTAGLWRSLGVSSDSGYSVISALLQGWWGTKHQLFPFALRNSLGIILSVLWNRLCKEIREFSLQKYPKAENPLYSLCWGVSVLNDLLSKQAPNF